MLTKLHLPFLFLLAVVGFITAPANPEAPDASMSILPYLATAAVILPLAKAVLVLYFSAALGGYQVTPGQVFSKAFPLWLGVLALSFLTSMAIMAGAMMFLVPGIIVAVRLSMAEYIYIVEGTTVMDAFKSSWERTGAYFWPLLNGFALLFIAVNLFGMIAGQVSNAPAWTAVVDIIAGLLQMLITVFGFRMYNQINEQPTPRDE